MTYGVAPPTVKELQQWFLDCCLHSYRVESTLYNLAKDPELRGHLTRYDIERPHDLVGPGNKLSWGVASGMALAYRLQEENQHPQDIIDIESMIASSRDLHRQSRHHQAWGWEDASLDADVYDLIVGSVDTIWSKIENERKYPQLHGNGRMAIEKVVDDLRRPNPRYLVGSDLQKAWMLRIGEKMQRFSREIESTLRDVHSIEDFYDPFLGLNQQGSTLSFYHNILRRLEEATMQLPRQYRNILPVYPIRMPERIGVYSTMY